MSARKGALELKPAARRDLRSIALYTGRMWGTAQRDAYLDDLDRTLATLRESPSIGRLRNEIQEGLRSFRVQQHMIYYRIDDEDVAILRILHVRMDVFQVLVDLLP